MDYQSAILAYFSDNNPLLKLQDQLRSAGVSGEFTAPEDLHLTLVLAFSDPAFVALQIPRFFDVFGIIVDGIDQFLTPDGRYAIYARVRYEGTLQSKHNWMAWNLQDEGVPVAAHTQPANYKPHITLCYSPAPIRPYEIDPLALLVNEVGVFNSNQERVMSYFMKSQKGALARVIDSVKNFFSADELDTAGSVFKSMGNGQWFAAYTNDFEDRDKEILTRAAHDRYIARLDNGLVPYPELWLKHIRGTRHGEALIVKRLGHIVFAAGKFDDTPEGRNAEKYYSQKGKVFELSHGFYFPPWAKTADGHYEDYNTFEISVLERGKAVPANQYTEFIPFEEVGTMPLSDQEKQHIIEVLGKDGAGRAIALAEAKEQQGEKIAALGAKFKVFTDATPPAPQAADKGASDASAKALSILLEAQEDMDKRQEVIEKGLEGAAVIIQKQKDEQDQAFKAFTDKLEAQLKEMRELAEKVGEILNGTPKRVDDTPAVQDPAAKEKAQQQQTKELNAWERGFTQE